MGGRKKKVVHITLPKGAKYQIHRKKSKKNPIILEVGGQKRKYHVALGYRRDEG
jgi:ribosomal protein L25 (general stress protein Ctc)